MGVKRYETYCGGKRSRAGSSADGAKGILNFVRRILILLLTLNLTLLALPPLAGPVHAQQGDRAEQIFAGMTVEERVGQLFLVTFRGSEADAESNIASLIRDHHVAGVILQAGNDNFRPAPDTAIGVSELAQALQELEYEGSQGDPIPDRESGEDVTATYIPLFIAVGDEESGVPIQQLISGMSAFPPQMAIGATWDPSLAEAVGEGMGEELSALGINLYLGPLMDVLEEPGQVGPGDLGSRTFGGDPYWVSRMGEAYVAGMHRGSEGRLAVFVKHFPGHGGSDRPLQEEVATVRKSIDQLLQIELPPFFAVTAGSLGDDPHIADGLLVSHIRYQGFQGNIRATTRPISLDPDAYSQLMALSPITDWRSQGGVTISDSLGSRAIRRFRDPLELRFQPQLVARDALVAGNDLLQLGNVRNPDDPDELTSVLSILSFFAQKYREDPVFAQRVDSAVLRILSLKLRQYDGVFLRSRVTPPTESIGRLGSNVDVSFSVFRSGATLVSPSPEEVSVRLGNVPGLGERIVFITDVGLVTRCSSCPTQTTMPANALERRINDLYGPGASGQVGTWNLWSFSMADLANYLGRPPDAVPPIPLASAEEVDEPLRTADWLIFSVLDVADERYGANALQVLLDERPDLVRNTNVVVFSFDVPYGLDATDLSKIDVYYGLYGASEPAIDVAARLLFEELIAQGAPPVSVPGIGYDLIEALRPASEQLISLTIEPVVGEGTPTPDVESGFTQGSIVRIETGVILDSNGNPIPDDTPVEFEIFQQSENIRQTFEAVSSDGTARIVFRLDRLGLFVIQARSDPALRSDVLQLDVQEGVPAFPTVIAPTPLPTDTLEPTETVEAQTATPDEPGQSEAVPDNTRVPQLSWVDLALGLLGIAMVSGGSYFYVGRTDRWIGSPIRCGLVAAVGGLIGYNYLALGLPGAMAIQELLAGVAGLTMGVLGGLAGIGLYSALQALTGEALDE
jgi:beta-N-acetylhexosaminidase